MKVVYVLLAIYAGKFGQDTVVATFPDVYACTAYAEARWIGGSYEGRDWVCLPTTDGMVTSSTGVLENPPAPKNVRPTTK